jgi:peptide/nickel transport system substrate-binding protein
MPRARRGLAVALALAVVGFLGAPARASELRVGVPRLPASADPLTLTALPEAMLARLVYQGLVTVGDRGDLEPGLAASWAVSADGLVWTFRLRPDVQFHDGTPLTPTDVVTSLSRQLDAEEWRGPGPTPPWARLFRGAGRLVRDIRADAGAVVIQLSQPHALLLPLLAHPGLVVGLPPRDGSDRWQGTGPFRPAGREADRLVLEATRPAPEGTTRVDRIVAVEIADDAAGLAGLGPSGGLDVFLAQNVPAWGALGLQVVSGPTNRLGWLALRTDQGPFSSRAVRQALALALDPGLIEPALGRVAVPPPSLWPLPPAGPRGPGVHAVDLGRARRLLGQAGALDSRVVLDVPEGVQGVDLLRLAEALKVSLASAGLVVEIRSRGPSVSRAAPAPDGDLMLLETQPVYPDPHAVLGPLLQSDAAPPAGTTNVARYRNPVADGFLSRASQLGFRPERLRLYQRLERVLAEDAPYVPLYVRLAWLVARPTVKGLAVDPAGLHRLERAWVDGSVTR